MIRSSCEKEAGAAVEKDGKRQKKKLDFVQDFIPVKRIRHGIVETTDGRFIKILEIEPINFMLRSGEEQFGILSSFASWLKISPMRLQFKSITRIENSRNYLFVEQYHLSPAIDISVISDVNVTIGNTTLKEAMEKGFIEQQSPAMLSNMLLGMVHHCINAHITGRYLLDDTSVEAIADTCWRAVKK